MNRRHFINALAALGLFGIPKPAEGAYATNYQTTLLRNGDVVIKPGRMIEVKMILDGKFNIGPIRVSPCPSVAKPA